MGALHLLQLISAVQWAACNKRYWNKGDDNFQLPIVLMQKYYYLFTINNEI